MDKKKIKSFLQRIWGTGWEQDQWAFIAYKGKGSGEFKQRSFRYPAQIDLIVTELSDSNQWADVYFCPHLFVSNRSRTKEYSAPTQVLWVDKDEGSLDDLQPKPTICWQTSQGKYQALWVLKEPLNPGDAEYLNRHLTYSTGADRGGWYFGKVLRLPGSINYKYDSPYRGVVLWENGPKYTPEEIWPRQSELEEAISDLSTVSRPLPKELPDLSAVLTEYGKIIPSAVWRLLNTPPEKDQDWSDQLWRIERLLAEAGLPPEHIFVVARDSPWNKYRRDQRPDEHLWAEVLKAVEDQEIPTEGEDQEELPWVTLDDVMIHAERPTWLVDGIWMEKNVGWIAGQGKSYKSILSLDLALSIATGHPFLGKYPVVDPGPVLMVQEEDPLWRVAYRIQLMAHSKGITGLNVTSNNNAWIMELKKQKVPFYLSAGGGLSFSEGTMVDALERQIDRIRPKMLVIDPWFMVSAGIDEFKAGEVTNMLGLLKSWRDKYGCSIAVVHHYNKGNGETRQKIYGSMAFYAWSENSLLVTREEDNRNNIIIERDIKDDAGEEKIVVEITNFTDGYEVEVAERNPHEEKPKGAYAKIEKYLKTARAGDRISRKEIIDNTGLNPRTVSNTLNKLEDDRKIEIEREGAGNQMWAVPKEGLFEGVDLGGELLL